MNLIMEGSVISLKIFTVGGYDYMLVIIIMLKIDRICIGNNK